MSTNNYFSHNTFDRHENRVAEVCDTWQRIESFYTDWLALAENIAAGQTRPKEAMNGWMNSPDHRHNILSENYSEIGVGFYKGEGDYTFYWVQNFGKKGSRFPVVINGEQAVTKNREVDLYMYGDWDQVRLRNEQGEWGPWIPFSNTMDWTLPDRKGTITVSAEMRAGDQSYQTSDTIEFLP